MITNKTIQITEHVNFQYTCLWRRWTPIGLNEEKYCQIDIIIFWQRRITLACWFWCPFAPWKQNEGLSRNSKSSSNFSVSLGSQSSFTTLHLFHEINSSPSWSIPAKERNRTFPSKPTIPYPCMTYLQVRNQNVKDPWQSVYTRSTPNRVCGGGIEQGVGGQVVTSNTYVAGKSRQPLDEVWERSRWWQEPRLWPERRESPGSQLHSCHPVVLHSKTFPWLHTIQGIRAGEQAPHKLSTGELYEVGGWVIGMSNVDEIGRVPAMM